MAMKDIEPKTRIEYFLNKIADGGSGGGGDSCNPVLNLDAVQPLQFNGEPIESFWYYDNNGTVHKADCTFRNDHGVGVAAPFDIPAELSQIGNLPMIFIYSIPENYGAYLDSFVGSGRLVEMYPVDLSRMSTEYICLTSPAAAYLIEHETDQTLPDESNFMIYVVLVSKDATFAYGEYEGGNIIH